MISSKALELLQAGLLDQTEVNYQTVLLAVDGSSPAVEATRHAVHLAHRTGARIVAVFVDDDGVEEVVPEDNWLAHAQADDRVLHGLAGINVARILAEERELPFLGVFLRGSLTRSVITLATRVAADVIVIGDTGLTGIKRVLLGSVAESIVEASHVPVLVVKQHALINEDK